MGNGVDTTRPVLQTGCGVAEIETLEGSVILTTLSVKIMVSNFVHSDTIKRSYSANIMIHYDQELLHHEPMCTTT